MRSHRKFQYAAGACEAPESDGMMTPEFQARARKRAELAVDAVASEDE